MIGFYDSGKGGMSIVSEIVKMHPSFSYLYYADTEILPLGSKSDTEIRSRVLDGVKYLFDQGCRLVILACNTASVHTIRFLQHTYLPRYHPDKNVLGVTTPLLEYTVQYESLKSVPGFLLATPATCRTEFYQQELKRQGFWVTTLPLPELAQAIEYHDQETIQHCIYHSIVPYDPQWVILACTHYTYVAHAIQSALPKTQIIDPTQYTALRVLWYLDHHPEYY